jgi:acylphosphatase
MSMSARIGHVIRRRVVVHGHVQGVFFRDSARRLAQRHGVAGWVANRPDGAVEAVFEGQADAVERLVAFSRKGPRGAQVESVEVSEEEPEDLRGFGVR